MINNNSYFRILIIFSNSCSERQESIDLPAQYKNLENLTVYSLDSEPPYHIRFDQEQSFGDLDEAFIGRLKDLAIDEDGRVYIADGDQLEIKVYDPDGRFLTRLVRQGQGPGEFAEISDIQAMADQVVVYDRNQQQTVVFSADSLAYSHTLLLAGNRSNLNELRGAYLNR